ncbi:hypothetical protein [Halococcus saccharolyticus]|uniref:DUF7998 domain-containing protein n=1 Tax=Halococcus saccharolyticus DSM 5350 TaxID=1227455 RepID=M0MK29_9EURY|nr:hypothetical protein [Halococcus saccharolyticus]EMA46032.1 hypothetical protein C449_04987 [Halococcus saccharolyticus DSM 5350]
MSDFPSPFSGSDDAIFDTYDEFVPDHLPEPGTFLDGQDLLSQEDHAAFHSLTKQLFEERGVYDMTFGYNLAQLNLDHRHPSAGYRYAEDVDDQRTLHAEFTPTTPFCPQSHTLTVGSFRAWNGLTKRHEYDLVSVRVHPMHHRSGEINDELADLEDEYLESGDDACTTPSEEGGQGVTPTDIGQRSGPTTPF